MDDVLTPEQYQQLLELGMLNAEMDPAIVQQQQMVERLRAGAEVPRGTMVSGHFVAPAATQYLAALGGTYKAGQKEAEVLAQQKMRADNARRQNQMVMGAIVGQPQAPQAPQAPQPPADPYAPLRTGGYL